MVALDGAFQSVVRVEGWAKMLALMHEKYRFWPVSAVLQSFPVSTRVRMAIFWVFYFLFLSISCTFQNLRVGGVQRHGIGGASGRGRGLLRDSRSRPRGKREALRKQDCGGMGKVGSITKA